MQEENRLRKIIQTGDVFKTIFNTPEFIEKIDELENRYFNEFKNSTDELLATKCWQRYQSLKLILTELEEPIKLAEIAEDNLNVILEMNDH